MKEAFLAYWPTIRAVMWRYVRVFVAAFAVTFGSAIQMIGGLDIFKESMTMSFPMFLDTVWKVSLYPASLSGIIAGISALGKLLRDTFGCGDGSTKIDKLPI